MPHTGLRFVALKDGHGISLLAAVQTGAPMRTRLQNGFQYGVAADLVQAIGSPIHTFAIGSAARRIRFQGRGSRGSRHILRAIDGAGLAAPQAASAARVSRARSSLVND